MPRPSQDANSPNALRADERGPRRAMAPKEHGAWGQLLVPMFVALAAARPTWISFALSVTVVLLFMAHEPLVLLLGQRGTRAMREAAPRAKLRLGVFLVAAASTGIAGFLAANWVVRAALLINVGLVAVALLAFLLRDNERSTLGELWIAMVLPAAAVPIAMAGNVDPITAMFVWASFALAYVAGIFGVRGIIAVHRKADRRAGWAGLFGVLVGVLLLIPIHPACALAAGVFWATMAICRLICPSPKSLRRIGWTLVGASLVQGVWLLVAVRAAS